MNDADSRDIPPYFNEADLSTIRFGVDRVRAAKERAYQHGEDDIGDALAGYQTKMERIWGDLGRLLKLRTKGEKS